MIASAGVRDRHTIGLGLGAGLCAALVLVFARSPAQAQAQKIVPCPAQQRALLSAPEIKSHQGKLRATLRVVDGIRTLWDSSANQRCATQYMRFFEGTDPANPRPWPATSDPIPGPTLRARVGDLVEITFFNQIDINHFASALDKGAAGTMEACDQYTSGGSSQGSAGNDKMPDCLHGSSTTNVHFHGTHTTPSTTGDNVLLFVRPSLGTKPRLQPSESQAHALLAPFFTKCEQSGPPKLWTDMPPAWQSLQHALLHKYDTTAPYLGHPGQLPVGMQLWPADEHQIAQKLWPQYQLGANPYCFPLPKYDPAKMRMGQAPGTHWYHAHKHGSTALNVANGMTGTFIIEGQYDDDLHHYYPNLQERVLMIQQLGTAPFPLTRGGQPPPPPPISVNGRLDPVVAMRPGEVQMWRIVNGAFRDAIEFVYFQSQSANQCGTASPPPTPPVQWRQIAQDGVQLNVANYRTFGAANSPLNLAPANRADLLVKAPAQPGNYTLCVVRNNALLVDPAATLGRPLSPSVLLTVVVGGAPVSPAMDFIPDAAFPAFPAFLKDVAQSEIRKRRWLVFGAGFNTIDDKKFMDGRVDQQMTLNTAEEWVVENQGTDKSHPFHIHINPFQILELFQPNAAQQPCPINPVDPDTFDPARTTFKPCNARILPAPWVWWDTFPIPTAHQYDISSTCTALAQCPPAVQPYAKCSSNKCSVIVNGWFRMRSRFVDFTGQYVLHCHILIHEDRGMMQLIEVTSDRTPYTHH